MKIFNQLSGHGGSKINFVDENNVLLGYDLTQDCCEHAGWFIADAQVEKCPEARESEPEKTLIDMPGWVFDPSFKREVRNTSFDEGGMLIFRIVNGPNEKFIHIFNAHNGYYGHGFEFTVGEETTEGGL